MTTFAIPPDASSDRPYAVSTVSRARPIAVSDPNIDVEWLEAELGRSAGIFVIRHRRCC